MSPWESGSSSAWPRRFRWAGEACSRSSAWRRRTRPSRSSLCLTTGCRCLGCSWTPPTRRWSPRGGGCLRPRGPPWWRTARRPAPLCRRPPSCVPPSPRGGSFRCRGRGWDGSSGWCSSPSTTPAGGQGGSSHLLQNRGRREENNIQYLCFVDYKSKLQISEASQVCIFMCIASASSLRKIQSGALKDATGSVLFKDISTGPWPLMDTVAF